MSKFAIFWLSFALLGVAFAFAERVWPARKNDGSTALSDVASVFLYQLLLFPMATGLTDNLEGILRFPEEVMQLPLAARVAIFYVVVDLGAYWIHRLLHTASLWRTHKWHHSPTGLYWLAGVRASVLQQVFFNLPYIFCLSLLADAPREVFLAMMIEGIFRNNFMHANLRWRTSLLEWVFVTPRFHAIHHGVDAVMHDKNFGVLFSVWDRLFRTYRNPDLGAPVEFGTGTAATDSVERMIIGI